MRVSPPFALPFGICCVCSLPVSDSCVRLNVLRVLSLVCEGHGLPSSLVWLAGDCSPSTPPISQGMHCVVVSQCGICPISFVDADSLSCCPYVPYASAPLPLLGTLTLVSSGCLSRAVFVVLSVVGRSLLMSQPSKVLIFVCDLAVC